MSIDAVSSEPDIQETFSAYRSEPDPCSFLQRAPTQKERMWLLNFLEIVGRGMIDADLQDPHIPLPMAELSSLYKTTGFRPNHMLITSINGMNTSKDTMVSHAEYLSSFVPNYGIDWVYNQTHGALADLVEVFALNYLGISLNTSDLLIENWTKFHETNKGNPFAKCLQFCHSQGAIHLKNALMNAPKEIRDRVIVVAIAPATVITSDLCFRASNYASKKDIVNYGEVIFAGLIDVTTKGGVPTLLIDALDHRKDLMLLEPHPGAMGIDHDWQSPTFRDAIDSHIKEYLKYNGEYK